MVLATYLSETELLLNDLSNQFYSAADLTAYINKARAQIAAESNALLATVSATLPAAASALGLSTITGGIGYSTALNIRTVSVLIGLRQAVLEGRPWVWFKNYYLNGAPSTATGVPTVWAQLKQGTTGDLHFSPAADVAYSLLVEASFLPAVLVSDADPEVIAYPWTDAICYYAAYLAYLNAQKPEGAARMLQQYRQYLQFARTGITPDVLPVNFPTQVDTIIPPGHPDGGGGQ